MTDKTSSCETTATGPRPERRGGWRGRLRRAVLSLELVVVLPILLLVLLAVVQFSTYLLATQALQAAALVGAREATLPGATPESVDAAVHRALAGWRFEGCIDEDDVVIRPLDWQTKPSGSCVGVMVRVDAKKAAMNSLMSLTGFAWTDEQICGRYVMRKE
jgi:hypothetical protein